jgi:hypothetical protein
VVAKAKSFVGANILLMVSAGIAPIVAVKPILWDRISLMAWVYIPTLSLFRPKFSQPIEIIE